MHYLIWIFSLFFGVANASGLISLDIQEQSSTLLVPFAAKELSVSSQISLEGYPNATFSTVANWPTTDDAPAFVRVLAIELEHNSSVGVRDLIWIESTRKIPASIKIPTDAVLLRQDRLRVLNSLFLHPQVANDDWYLLPQSRKAAYVTDTDRLKAHKYPMTKASQWLYDRPQALFQLSYMSGENRWATSALEFSKFYIEHVSPEGFFDLVKLKDPKYLLPRGLWYYYLSSGDIAAKRAIVRIYEASLKWDPVYELDRGFWTERNQAAALNAAVVYWEMTNNRAALQRIQHIISSSSQMTFEPLNKWPYRGCMQHSYTSHEGKKGESAVCSPWMTAIFSEVVWRYYRLSNDPMAGKLLSAFSEFIDQYGTYIGSGRLDGKIIPAYLVAFEDSKLVQRHQWTDPQHSCDVLGLYLRSLYITAKEVPLSSQQKDLAQGLLNNCKYGYRKAQQEPNGVWRVKPARRFGWVYSSTSDLPWLVAQMLPQWKP